MREQLLARPDKARELRAKSVLDHFAELGGGGPVDHNGVHFLVVADLGNGGVSVSTGPHDVETDYRIFNPPTLVKDGSGSVEIGGKRYREDPLGALADVIRQHRQGQSKGRVTR
jgi:hypothetical protein